MFGGTKHTLSVELIQQIKKHKTFLLCADNPVASENTFLLYWVGRIKKYWYWYCKSFSCLESGAK